jgi:hypothetical protein
MKFRMGVSIFAKNCHRAFDRDYIASVFHLGKYCNSNILRLSSHEYGLFFIYLGLNSFSNFYSFQSIFLYLSLA